MSSLQVKLFFDHVDGNASTVLTHWLASVILLAREPIHQQIKLLLARLACPDWRVWCLSSLIAVARVRVIVDKSRAGAVCPLIERGTCHLLSLLFTPSVSLAQFYLASLQSSPFSENYRAQTKNTSLEFKKKIETVDRHRSSKRNFDSSIPGIVFVLYYDVDVLNSVQVLYV